MAIPALMLSPLSLRLAADRSSEFAAGVRVQADCGVDGLRHGTVRSSDYAGDTETTTVALDMDPGQPLTGNLSGVLHGNDLPASLCAHVGLHAAGGRDALTPAAIGALGLDCSAEVPITGAISLDASAFGRMHVCGGTAADYTVTLPPATGNAGKLLGIRIANSCAKLVTVAGAGAEAIDGAAARELWAGESALLLCEGVGWTKLAGRSLAMRCKMQANAVQSVPSGANTRIGMDVAPIDNAGMASVSDDQVNIRRRGLYSVAAHISMYNSIGYLVQIQTPRGTVTGQTPPAGGFSFPILGQYLLERGEHAAFYIYQTTGTAQSTYTNPYGYLYVEEVLTW